ncbi:MAG: oxidoreductase, partial [Thermoleophilaceae bacterium]|nr:oxidoreductase [Thermoleophilaceae bacterium]
TEPGSYPSFYRGVVQAIREGTAPPATAADAVAGLEVIHAARASAKTRRVAQV